MTLDLTTWQRKDARRRAQQLRSLHRRRWGEPYGWLHSLRCDRGPGNHRAVVKGRTYPFTCTPIPIYDPRMVAE